MPKVPDLDDDFSHHAHIITKTLRERIEDLECKVEELEKLL